MAKPTKAPWMWLLVVAVLAAGCSSSLGGGGDDSMAHELAGADAGAGGGERNRVRETSWDFVVASDEGTRLHVSFTGGNEGALELDPCATDYEVEFVESGIAVEVHVWELAATDKSAWPDNARCTDVGYGWALSADLEQPLGDRTVSGGSVGQVAIAHTEDLLVPTLLPAGWQWKEASSSATNLWVTYGPREETVQHAGSFNDPIVLGVSPVAEKIPVVSEVLKVAGSDRVSIRSDSDGAIATRKSGVTVLAFEHAGWSYDLRAQQGIDPAVLQSFARNMRDAGEREEYGFTSGLAAPDVSANNSGSFGSVDLDLAELFSSEGSPDAENLPVPEQSTDPVPISGTIDWETALTEGRTVTVNFVGSSPGGVEDPCAKQYEATARETADEVIVTINFQGFNNVLCDSIGYGWAVTTTLEEPLGQRTLRSGKTSAERQPVQLETRLVPTWLPENLRLKSGADCLPEQRWRYVFADDEDTTAVSLSSNPISLRPRLHALRQLDGHEAITIRNENDGVITPNHDGGTILGFEEQGWYYRITGAPGVDPDTLIQFAGSFERPARIDAASLPERLTVPLFESQPQPGQDGR